MADFRRVVTALAVLALLSGFAVTANAQTFACTASAAVPPLLRAEGLTELTGDIVMNCTGGVAPPATPVSVQPTQLANISIFLGNTTVTSRILDSNNGSEALLLIDEPAPANVFVSGNVTTGCGNLACTTPLVAGGGYSASNPNAFRGIVSGNSVTFIGIPIVPPGTTIAGATRVFRITNVRANASTVGAGPAGTPGQVQAFISITGPASVPISGLATQVVGFVQNGLTTSLRNAANDDTSSGVSLQQCTDYGRTTVRATLRFSENFATAFKVRGTTAQTTPGAVYNTESGFVVPTITGGGFNVSAVLGLADFGTRLKATFANIPTGVSVYVSTTNINPLVAITTQTPATTETRLASLVVSEGSAFVPATPATNTSSPVTGLQIAQVALSGGAGTAVWEVLASDNLLTQSYDFAIYLAATANVSGNSPAPGVQGTVAGSYAPTSTVTTASSTAPIPRFVDTSSPRNLVRVAVCRTNILYPFVTNASGFDTGMAIANTTKDPFGTGAQAGTCSLNFYGDNAPSAITTPSIATGTVYATAASISAPNFQGYVIAVCNFQLAHGFAYVQSSVGYNPTTTAMGYLALIIPETARAIPAAGESLGN